MSSCRSGVEIEVSSYSAWASVYEVYVVVVAATTLLLKLDAQVHNWVSRGTSLGGPSFFLELVILVI